MFGGSIDLAFRWVIEAEQPANVSAETFAFTPLGRSPDSSEIDLPGPSHHVLPLRTEFGDTEFDHVTRLQVHRGRLSAHANAGRCTGGDEIARIERHELADIAYQRANGENHGSSI